MKKYGLLLILLLISTLVYAAGVLDYTADTSPTSDDIIYVINDPGGTPADKKVTLGNAITKAHGLTGASNILKLDGSNIISATGFVIVAPTTGGILYGTGTGTYTPLAAGTASQLLQMNAGATAPEWATRAADVTGPAGGVADGDVVGFDGETGKIIKKITSIGSVSVDLGVAVASGHAVTMDANGVLQTAFDALLPDAVAGASVGSTAIPWSSIFIGDAATNNVQLINTAAASAVVLTLPSTTGTLARLEDKISDLAASTSAELAGKISNETGSGLLVFNDSPTLVAPVLGAATATSLLATGIVDGTAPVIITATSAGYTLGATYKSGYTFTNPVAAAATFNFTLPTAAAGLQYCVANGATKTGVLKVNASAAGQYIDLDGTLSATGGFVSATAVAGNMGCFVGIDATNWKAIPTKGTWSRD